MIKKILIAIEEEARDRVCREEKSLIAVKTVMALINQIDHEVEEVPFQDRDRLSRLLVSLKGCELNEEENQLINRIIKSK